MKRIGERIFYNEEGEIIFTLGEMQGDIIDREEIKEINYIDLEFGYIDYTKFNLIKIDVNTKKPVLEQIEKELSEEEKKIVKLEKEKSELIFKLMEEDNGGEN